MTESQQNIFGTDGVRDVEGRGALAPESVRAIGVALARHLGDRSSPRVFVGRDTRRSGPEIERALTAELEARGVEVHPAGVIPTPAVANLVTSEGFDLGLVISASHNPPEFNGIKVFDERGWKLDVEVEEAITRHYYEALREGRPPSPPVSGRAEEVEQWRSRYLAQLPTPDLAGLRIVLDCARGATSTVAESAFRRTGATVTLLNDELDGDRINVGCGSLAPEQAGARVVELGADLGIAFDGDGDRALLLDDTGALVDGDDLMALWATALAEAGTLNGNLLIATVMSNAGFESYLRDRGIELVRTPVGDREVFRAIEGRRAVLGGEQSGHIIFRPEGTTGDGIRTGLHIAALVRASGRRLSELRAEIPRFPQTLIGVSVARKQPFDELPGVNDAIRSAETQLADRGRVLVRYSGTEPLARILIEGPDAATNAQLAESIARPIRDAIGS